MEKNSIKKFFIEFKKIWHLSGPAFFMFICQYSLGAVTQLFVGRLGTLELAAFTVENNLIAGFCLGIMLGMGCALETLCGQAFGAGQEHMLGIYMQRSWVILNSTGIILSFIYVFAAQFLKAIGQAPDIAEAAGKLAHIMIPQLFAYAMHFPVARFLQAQSKVMVMAAIAGVAVFLHVFFTWLVTMKLKWGMVGAAVVLDGSWWFMVVANLIYVWSGQCKSTWIGFSLKAFVNLWGFIKLSLSSAVMLCLEVWYYAALVLVAGYLKNVKISMDALSICLNIVGWATMISVGFYTGVRFGPSNNVRVANELGAARPNAARFAVVVAVITSFGIGLILSIILLILRTKWPSVFTQSKEVQEYVCKLTFPLIVTVIINSVQPVLSGVATGGGWQALVAYVNIGCYYAFGLPLGLILGIKLHMGVKGIWYGMLVGSTLQSLIILLLIWRTNWNKEVADAGDRLKQWTGHTEDNGVVKEEKDATEMASQCNETRECTSETVGNANCN